MVAGRNTHTTNVDKNLEFEGSIRPALHMENPINAKAKSIATRTNIMSMTFHLSVYVIQSHLLKAVHVFNQSFLYSKGCWGSNRLGRIRVFQHR